MHSGRKAEIDIDHVRERQTQRFGHLYVRFVNKTFDLQTHLQQQKPETTGVFNGNI